MILRAKPEELALARAYYEIVLDPLGRVDFDSLSVDDTNNALRMSALIPDVEARAEELVDWANAKVESLKRFAPLAEPEQTPEPEEGKALSEKQLSNKPKAKKK